MDNKNLSEIRAIASENRERIAHLVETTLRKRVAVADLKQRMAQQKKEIQIALQSRREIDAKLQDYRKQLKETQKQIVSARMVVNDAIAEIKTLRQTNRELAVRIREIKGSM
jgi:chromosome segregation ATPase